MRGLHVLLLVTLATVLGMGSAAAAQAQDPNVDATAEEQIQQLLAEGVNLYRVGAYDEAALRLKDALLLDPDNRTLFEFYLAMGDVLLIQMSRRAELETVMEDILRKARIYQKKLRHDPRYINLMITKLRASEKERIAANHELVAIGPLAVPHLVAKLADHRQDDYRVWARAVLTDMGYRAVIPLTESLNTDDPRVLTSVGAILANIGDPRALPKLTQLINADGTDSTVREVCQNAVAAIAARSGMVTIPDSQQLHYQEALRYFREGSRVRDEVVANESLFWRWDEDAEPKLTHTRVPPYAWSELIAEELLYDGMHHFPEFDAFQPLIAAVLAAQEVEVDLRLRLARDRTTPPSRPEETVAALEERAAALDEAEDRVVMVGPRHLYRSVQQAIVSERYDVSQYLMKLLQDRYLADAEAMLPAKEIGLAAGLPGSVLVAALDHPEKRVRYAAAITLAHLDPELRFFNAERVIPLLSEAVGEWGMVAVLLVEPDNRHRNAGRQAILKQGLLATATSDGFEARHRINQSPVKDAIIIAGDLVPTLRDEHGVVIDVPEQTAMGLVQVFADDPRTQDTPIFIALPPDPEIANEIQAAFAGKVEGFIQKPYDGVEIKGKVEMVIGDSELPQVNRAERERISLEACQALRAIDPVKTQYPLDEAAPALVATIDQRADPIRIEALHALGHTGVAEHLDRVTEVYESQIATLTGKPAVRSAFLYAIGLLQPTTDSAKAILSEAMQADELEVRETAQWAAGHAENVSNTDRTDYLRQQRLDVLGAGVGQLED